MIRVTCIVIVCILIILLGTINQIYGSNLSFGVYSLSDYKSTSFNFDLGVSIDTNIYAVPCVFGLSKSGTLDNSSGFDSGLELNIITRYLEFDYINSVSAYPGIYIEYRDDYTIGLGIKTIQFLVSNRRYYLQSQGFSYWKHCEIGTDILLVPPQYQIPEPVINYLKMLLDNRLPYTIQSWQVGDTFEKDYWMCGLRLKYEYDPKILGIKFQTSAQIKIDTNYVNRYYYKYCFTTACKFIRLYYTQDYDTVFGDMSKHLSLNYVLEF